MFMGPNDRRSKSRLPRGICKTGIPTEIRRSTIISRRFCQRDLNLWGIFHDARPYPTTYVSPSGCHSGGCGDKVEAADNAETASGPCDPKSDLNARC